MSEKKCHQNNLSHNAGQYCTFWKPSSAVAKAYICHTSHDPKKASFANTNDNKRWLSNSTLVIIWYQCAAGEKLSNNKPSKKQIKKVWSQCWVLEELLPLYDAVKATLKILLIFWSSQRRTWWYFQWVNIKSILRNEHMVTDVQIKMVKYYAPVLWWIPPNLKEMISINRYGSLLERHISVPWFSWIFKSEVGNYCLTYSIHT